jgi:predicted RNA binding protein YcfA (HicA-like mRNA interferase family)
MLEMRLFSIQGSHYVYSQPNNPTRISIPIHANKDLKVGLLKHFLKQANLTEEDIE